MPRWPWLTPRLVLLGSRREGEASLGAIALDGVLGIRLLLDTETGFLVKELYGFTCGALWLGRGLRVGRERKRGASELHW